MLSGDTLSAAPISTDAADKETWDDESPTQDASYAGISPSQSPNWQDGSIA